MESYETERERELRQTAVRLVLAMMASASTEKIRPVDWWQRAKTALVSAADRAASWGELVATMARRLQIDVTRIESSRAISLVAVHDPRDFSALIQIIRREAVYLIAEAQMAREQQRAEAKGERIEIPEVEA